MHFMPLNTASDAKVNSTCHIVTSIWNITKLLALLRLIKFNSTSSTTQTQLQLSRGTGMQGRWKPLFVTHIATGSPQVFLANTWNKHVCHHYCKMFWPQGMITKQQGNNIAQFTASTQPVSQDAKGGSSAMIPMQPPHEFFFWTFLLNHDGLQKLVPHLLHCALC